MVIISKTVGLIKDNNLRVFSENCSNTSGGTMSKGNCWVKSVKIPINPNPNSVKPRINSLFLIFDYLIPVSQ